MTCLRYRFFFLESFLSGSVHDFIKRGKPCNEEFYSESDASAGSKRGNGRLLSRRVSELAGELGAGPMLFLISASLRRGARSASDLSPPTPPVLHLQLHSGADILLRVPAGELRAENVHHDGGAGGLQHRLPPHPRPRPGQLQPGPV